MIRRTLLATQDATFCVQLPSLHPAAGGLPVPTGTGFFVADDGWFVTARHVVAHADGSLRSDVGDAWLMKEMRGFGGSGAMCQWPELVFEDAVSDLALLKVDFSRNANKDWLSGREGFPHLISRCEHLVKANRFTRLVTRSRREGWFVRGRPGWSGRWNCRRALRLRLSPRLWRKRRW